MAGGHRGIGATGATGAAMLAASLLAGAGAAGAAEVRLKAAIGNEIVQLVEAGPAVFQVVVNDQVVFEDREGHAVAFVNAYNLQGRWLVLLRQSTDGGGCAARYRVLDLSGPKPGVSAPFGTCRDAAEIAAAGGVLTVSMPAAEGAGTAAWTYSDGRLARAR